MGTAGTYALVLNLEAGTKLQVGRLGEFTFAAGVYCYVGSARGPGGLNGRLARHLRQRKRSHWHIDYLLQGASVLEVWTKPSSHRLECAWAAALLTNRSAEPMIPGFGSSDCGCSTHLIYVGSSPALHPLRRQLRTLGAELLRSPPLPDS